jgi:hypothetical protein
VRASVQDRGAPEVDVPRPGGGQEVRADPAAEEAGDDEHGQSRDGGALPRARQRESEAAERDRGRQQRSRKRRATRPGEGDPSRDAAKDGPAHGEESQSERLVPWSCPQQREGDQRDREPGRHRPRHFRPRADHDAVEDRETRGRQGDVGAVGAARRQGQPLAARRIQRHPRRKIAIDGNGERRVRRGGRARVDGDSPLLQPAQGGQAQDDPVA